MHNRDRYYSSTSIKTRWCDLMPGDILISMPSSGCSPEVLIGRKNYDLIWFSAYGLAIVANEAISESTVGNIIMRNGKILE